MKKLLCFVLVMVMVGWFASPVMAQQQIGLGGAWIQGAHSDNGEFAMENDGSDGWGINAFYDAEGWKKKVSEGHSFGITPGLDYKYLRWTKTNNAYREVCEDFKWNEDPYPQGDREWCPRCENEKYKKSTEKVNSQILSGTLKPFWEYKDFRLFGIGGVGIEVENSDDADLALTAGIGAQYFFTKNLGLSVSAQEVYSNPTDDYKRWDLVVGNLVYRW